MYIQKFKTKLNFLFNLQYDKIVYINKIITFFSNNILSQIKKDYFYIIIKSTRDNYVQPFEAIKSKNSVQLKLHKYLI